MQKKMKIVILIFYGLWAVNLNAQPSSERTNPRKPGATTKFNEIVENLKKLKSELNSETNKQEDADLSKDFEEMRNSFSKSEKSFMDIFGTDDDPYSGDLYQMKWRDEKTGRVLEITPNDKQTELKISVEGEFITIKGNRKSTKQAGKNIVSEEHFEFTQNIPEDLDPSRNKISEKNGKIEIAFPWKGNTRGAPKKKKLEVFQDDKVPMFDAQKDDVI